jgi:hypothetical protein
MPPSKFRVFVKKNGAVVRPAVEFADDEIHIINHTQQDIVVSLPGNVFEDNAGNLNPNPETVTVKKGVANKLEREIHNDAQTGIHEFKVFCVETFTFAQGNSDPEFIIEP